MTKSKIPFVVIGLLALFTFAANAQWVQTNGRFGSNVTALAVTGGGIFAGTLDNGIYRSIDSGTNWTAVYSGFPYCPCPPPMECLVALKSNVLCLAADGNNIFAGTSCAGVILSADNGTPWTSIGPASVVIQSLAKIGPNLFAGTYGYSYRLADYAATWAAVGSGLTNMTVLSFVVNNGRIFAGTNGGGVFVSTDSGTSWTAVNSGLPNSTVACLAACGDNIFAAVRPTVYHGPITGVAADTAGMESGLYVSADNGAS
jgi:hypothetical protein